MQLAKLLFTYYQFLLIKDVKNLLILSEWHCVTEESKNQRLKNQRAKFYIYHCLIYFEAKRFHASNMTKASSFRSRFSFFRFLLLRAFSEDLNFSGTQTILLASDKIAPFAFKMSTRA